MRGAVRPGVVRGGRGLYSVRAVREGRGGKGREDGATKSPICCARGSRAKLVGLQRNMAGKRTCGSFSAAPLPRVPERGRGFVSAGNCWLLGKLSCQVRHGIGGCVWDVDRHSEFTNVYRAAQQGNGSVGGGGKRPHAPSARKTPIGMAPLRALTEPGLRSDFYRGLISILRTSRFGLLVIGLGVPMECPYQSAAELLVAEPEEGGHCAVTGTGLCFRCLLFSLEGRGGGGGRVDLNVFGSPGLRPRIGHWSCRGGPWSLVLCCDWRPAWPPPYGPASPTSGGSRGGARRPLTASPLAEGPAPPLSLRYPSLVTSGRGEMAAPGGRGEAGNPWFGGCRGCCSGRKDSWAGPPMARGRSSGDPRVRPREAVEA